MWQRLSVKVSSSHNLLPPLADLDENERGEGPSLTAMSKEEWSNQLSGDSRYLLSLLVVEVGGRGELEEAAVGLAAASDSAVTEVASSCRLMLKTSLPPGVAGVALALAVVVDPRSPTREELSASSLADAPYMSQVWSLNLLYYFGEHNKFIAI